MRLPTQQRDIIIEGIGLGKIEFDEYPMVEPSKFGRRLKKVGKAIKKGAKKMFKMAKCPVCLAACAAAPDPASKLACTAACKFTACK